MSFPRIDHGFDRKRHAFLQRNQCVRTTVVNHLWFIVKHPSDAMTAELPDHGEVIALRIGLYGITNIAEPGTGSHRFDALVETLLGYPHEALAEHTGFTHKKHLTGVAVITVFDHCDIDI